MKRSGPVLLFALFAAALWGEPQPQLTVFLPDGAQARLSGGGAERELLSGVALGCPEGNYRLTVTHPDYEPFSRTLKIAQNDVVVLPRLTLSSAFRSGQVSALSAQRRKAVDERNGFLAAAGVTGAAALAGAAAVGTLEVLLAGKKNNLAAAQDRYRAASAGEAPALWAGVESVKADIADLRTYENYALATSGVLTVGSLVFLFTGPDPRDWDSRIRQMGGTVE